MFGLFGKNRTSDNNSKAITPVANAYIPSTGSGGWWSVIKEPFSGAWQRNIEWKRKDVLCYPSIFACTTLICGDISKLPIYRVRKDSDDIWSNIPLGDYSFLERPNSYQNRIQFFESWFLSKLIRGNAYIYIDKDEKDRVRGLHVLHPDRVLPVITTDGDVFYQLSGDNLAGITETGITIPADRIIHDRFNCFFHPLVGLSPLFAAGLPAYMGLQAMENSARFQSNGSVPSGVLTIPEAITKEQGDQIKADWKSKYSGKNFGEIAVLGGDVKYQAITMTAKESQLVELLDLSDVRICGIYHVPPYKVGIGNMPSYNNVQALNQEYYNTALMVLIESAERCLDQAFGMKEDEGFEFGIENLLRMDTKTQLETLKEGVNAAIYSPNEARGKLNLPKVTGGNSPMIQQQNYSLEAIAKRDASEDPFKTTSSSSPPSQPTTTEERGIIDATEFFLELRKEMKNGR